MTSNYTVRPSPGEGLGCFSNTAISAGTLILREVPLFAVREPRSNTAVVQAFSELSISEQEQYLELYAVNPDSEGSARVDDIFNSNAWQTGSRTSILLRAARFNHSCIPNATLAWNSQLSCVTVHAIITIPAHSQIHLCYVRPYQTRVTRYLKLSAYGFSCACSACSSDSVASEIRRKRMIALDAKIRIARRQKWRSGAPKEALKLARLLKEEGIVGEALGLAYHDASEGWKKIGRSNLALEYAMKELEVCTMCYGVDSMAAGVTMQLVRDLKLEIEGNVSKR